MGSIAAFIVAIAKAIPAARAIYEQSVDLFYSYEEGQDQSQMNDLDVERTAIVHSLKQPGLTDEQNRVFRRRLIALSKL